jgi:hypothetical protein
MRLLLLFVVVVLSLLVLASAGTSAIDEFKARIQRLQHVYKCIAGPNVSMLGREYDDPVLASCDRLVTHAIRGLIEATLIEIEAEKQACTRVPMLVTWNDEVRLKRVERFQWCTAVLNTGLISRMERDAVREACRELMGYGTLRLHRDYDGERIIDTAMDELAAEHTSSWMDAPREDE